MTVKVISFLGTVVRPTVYLYQNQTYEGSLFQIALRQCIDFDTLLVFVTPQALEKAYPTLEALGDARIRPVNIPAGQTSAELWQIFETLVEHVEETDQVIFDITHGLRSIPFLTFLAAAYLRSARAVMIKKVLYGALELGSPAPVIDLTEFVTLLDWLTATNQFIKTGNAVELASLLGHSQYPTVQALAQTVEKIATGLHLLRPFESSQAAGELGQKLATVKQELPAPFVVLSNEVWRSYGRFGQAGQQESRMQLSYHLEMIYWYHRGQQWTHALSLGREWVVSLLCYHFGLDVLDQKGRAEMEFLLSGGKQGEEGAGPVRESRYRDQWSTVPQDKELRRLWGDPYKLANLRNDVLHSGFRRNPKAAEVVIKETNTALNKLYEIAVAWGFPAHPPIGVPDAAH